MKLPKYLIVIWTIALLIFSSSAPECAVKVTLYGAAGTISGAMAIIETEQSRVIIDCGAFFPEGSGSIEKRQEIADNLSREIPAPALDAKAVILTHAHADHIGRLQTLHEKGFKGQILMTSATAEIAPIMLRNQARYDEVKKRNWIWSIGQETKLKYPLTLHWMTTCPELKMIKDSSITVEKSLKEIRAEFQTRLNHEIKTLPCKECAKLSIIPLVSKFKTFQESIAQSITDDISFYSQSAGHIPGAVSIIVSVKTVSGIRKIGFSGDVGAGVTPLYDAPKKLHSLDAIFIETTYPEARKEDSKQNIEKFKSYISDRLAHGGVILIPAYALDRTQQVIYQLSSPGILPSNSTIFSLSTTANEISDLYRNHPEWFTGNSNIKARLLPPQLREGFKGFPGFDKISGPSVIIATGIIVTSAFKERTLDKFLLNSNNSLVFVGYEDPETPQGQLKAGNSSVIVNGAEVPVKVKVDNFGGFSGHADSSSMDDLLSSLSKNDTKIILVHGEKEGLQIRAAGLTKSGWRDVRVANFGEPIELFKNK